MQVNNIKPLLDIGARAIVSNCNKISLRTHFKKPFHYEKIYRGKFEQHDTRRYPRSMNPYREEELLDDIHSIKNLQIDKPSPFHIVKRIHGTAGTIKGWHQWVTLRRLNLHSTQPGDISIIPNTPQFNEMLAKIKHLVTLRPAILPDGRLPRESDIGALKICPETGKVIIDEKLRLLANRGYKKPYLWEGTHMRFKLKRLTGIHHYSHLR